MKTIHILATIVAICAAIGCVLEGFSGENEAALVYCVMFFGAAVVSVMTDTDKSDTIN